MRIYTGTGGSDAVITVTYAGKGDNPEIIETFAGRAPTDKELVRFAVEEIEAEKETS